MSQEVSSEDFEELISFFGAIGINDVVNDIVNEIIDKIEGQNILLADNWSKLESFIRIQSKISQLEYYIQNDSNENVIKLVEMESKTFGSICENIICEIFKIGKRSSSENDGVKNGKKIEIKSARYWAGKNDCKWQHLEENHDYDYVLFVLLDFQGFKVWGIKKSLLFGVIKNNNILIRQGHQGYWTNMSKIMPYLILNPIITISDLDNFLL